MPVTPDAVARREMAREKARILGTQSGGVPRLEEKAQQWRTEQKAREKQEYTFKKQKEKSTIAFEQVALWPPPKPRAATGKEDGGIAWKQYHPEGEEPRGVRLNSAMIAHLALTIRTKEWNRAMGKTKRRDPGLYALEQEALRWQYREARASGESQPRETQVRRPSSRVLPQKVAGRRG